MTTGKLYKYYGINTYHPPSSYIVSNGNPNLPETGKIDPNTKEKIPYNVRNPCYYNSSHNSIDGGMVGGVLSKKKFAIESWSSKLAYRQGSVVVYNGHIYLASKFIYLTSSNGIDPLTAICDNGYDRNVKVWHPICSVDFLIKKSIYSNKNFLWVNDSEDKKGEIEYSINWWKIKKDVDVNRVGEYNFFGKINRDAQTNILSLVTQHFGFNKDRNIYFKDSNDKDIREQLKKSPNTELYSNSCYGVFGSDKFYGGWVDFITTNPDDGSEPKMIVNSKYHSYAFGALDTYDSNGNLKSPIPNNGMSGLNLISTEIFINQIGFSQDAYVPKTGKNKEVSESDINYDNEYGVPNKNDFIYASEECLNGIGEIRTKTNLKLLTRQFAGPLPVVNLIDCHSKTDIEGVNNGGDSGIPVDENGEPIDQMDTSGDAGETEDINGGTDIGTAKYVVYINGDFSSGEYTGYPTTGNFFQDAFLSDSPLQQEGLNPPEYKMKNWKIKTNEEYSPPSFSNESFSFKVTEDHYIGSFDENTSANGGAGNEKSYFQPKNVVYKIQSGGFDYSSGFTTEVTQQNAPYHLTDISPPSFNISVEQLDSLIGYDASGEPQYGYIGKFDISSFNWTKPEVWNWEQGNPWDVVHQLNYKNWSGSVCYDIEIYGVSDDDGQSRFVDYNSIEKIYKKSKDKDKDKRCYLTGYPDSMNAYHETQDDFDNSLIEHGIYEDEPPESYSFWGQSGNLGGNFVVYSTHSSTTQDDCGNPVPDNHIEETKGEASDGDGKTNEYISSRKFAYTISPSEVSFFYWTDNPAMIGRTVYVNVAKVTQSYTMSQSLVETDSTDMNTPTPDTPPDETNQDTTSDTSSDNPSIDDTTPVNTWYGNDGKPVDMSIYANAPNAPFATPKVIQDYGIKSGNPNYNPYAPPTTNPNFVPYPSIK